MIEKIIMKEIHEFEKQNNAKVLLVVETGSRSFGFASRESDYDIRFVYVKNKDFYLQLNKFRDMIELIHTDELDIVGFDLTKFLKLLRSSNPSVIEWLLSKPIYEDSQFYKIRAIAIKYFNAFSLTHHYLHMSENQDRRYIFNQGATKKRYLHSIRGTLSALYIIKNNKPAPIKFSELTYLLPQDMVPIVDGIIVDKICGIASEPCDNIPKLDKWLEDTNRWIDNYLKSTRSAELTTGIRSWDEINQLFLEFLD